MIVESRDSDGSQKTVPGVLPDFAVSTTLQGTVYRKTQGKGGTHVVVGCVCVCVCVCVGRGGGGGGWWGGGGGLAGGGSRYCFPGAEPRVFD